MKTPTRSQFEHSEFPCGEKRPNFEQSGSSHKSVKFSEKSEFFPKYEQQRGQSFQYRKRKQSFRTDSHVQYAGFRRKRAKSMPSVESNIVLPTKFLLGGNINDPLNLNSLNDEEVNRILNQETPKSSPVEKPATEHGCSVAVPCNINDPLNLETSDEFTNKKKKRNKHKRKSDDPHSSSATQVPKESEKRKGLMQALKIEVDDIHVHRGPPPSASGELKPLEIHFSEKPKVDKIVSPVIPQISPRMRRRRRAMSMSDARPEFSSAVRSILRTSLSPPRGNALDIEMDKVPHPQKRAKRHNSHKNVLPKYQKNPKFIYGNYNRYYGYRNPNAEEDQRLFSLKKEWFEGKDILDIGCNVGHLTLAIGRDYSPSRIVGMDIDGTLISAARKNIRHYLSNQSKESEKFPASNSLNYGPIAAPPVCDPNVNKFPKNVAFVQVNIPIFTPCIFEDSVKL